MSTTVASAVSIFFGLLGLILSLVSIATNNWITIGEEQSGLWRKCIGDDCSNVKVGADIIYKNYETVRGFGVLAVCMAFLGVVIGLALLIGFAVKKKEIVSPTAIASLFLLSAFFALICYSLFTSLVYTHDRSSGFGYSFGLGWASFPMTVIAGGIMVYVQFGKDKEE